MIWIPFIELIASVGCWTAALAAIRIYRYSTSRKVDHALYALAAGGWGFLFGAVVTFAALGAY